MNGFVFLILNMLDIILQFWYDGFLHFCFFYYHKNFSGRQIINLILIIPESLLLQCNFVVFPIKFNVYFFYPFKSDLVQRVFWSIEYGRSDAISDLTLASKAFDHFNLSSCLSLPLICIYHKNKTAILQRNLKNGKKNESQVGQFLIAHPLSTHQLITDG